MKMRLRSGSKVSVVSPDELLFGCEYDGERYYRFRAPGIATAWASLRDGLTSASESDLKDSQTEPLVEQLIAHGLLVPVGSGLNTLAALGDIQPTTMDEAGDVVQHLASTSVLVVGAHHLTGEIVAALAEWGVTQTQIRGGGADLMSDMRRHAVTLAICCPDDPLLTECNRHALDAERPWLPIVVNGLHAKVGPFVVPKETACYRCDEMRHLSNLQHYKEHKEMRKNGQHLAAPVMAVPAYILAVRFAVAEVIKWLLANSLGTAPLTLNKAMYLDFWTFKADLHSVLRFPRCPECGLAPGTRPTIMPWMDEYDYQR